jgi:glycosyltransferase involved in cell wall biosynthesis
MAAEKARVSVIVPHYNRPEFLPGCLASIRGQTWQPHEVIVVDDCSKPASYAIAEDVCKEYGARILRRDSNAGASAARNRGVKEASGNILQFVDCDDLLPPDSLKARLSLLEANPGALWAAGGTRMVPSWVSLGQLAGLERFGLIRLVGKPLAFSPPETLPDSEMHRVRWCHCAILFRRELFERFGGYDERLSVSEDKELRWRYWWMTQSYPVTTTQVVYWARQGRRRDRLTRSGGDKSAWIEIAKSKIRDQST